MRSKPSAKAPSQRQQRVAEEIRNILSGILLRGEFSRRTLSLVNITITHVSVSPDLRNAKIYTIPLGGGDMTDTLTNLNEMAGEIRFALAKQLTTKYVPALRFYSDNTFDEARHIEDLLDTAMKRETALGAKASDDEK
ncbi:30S ribosome-binding factor RbfA [Candidatus Odyssella acanthamoebae]|uniref:30S ribosome-binding factor RbfA n=1 Tax=Candidatus Odyssella acanthamoebae TaxID=91604 RepID=UPI00056E4FA0|nr:30S ribosome-binding factor RbfA [Candidatus Paracaedibacter acanthamoebae]